MRLNAKVTELLGWTLLFATCLYFFVQSVDYGLGTVRSMKAGAYPAMVSGALGLTSVWMFLATMLRPTPSDEPQFWDLRASGAVLAALAAFALTVRPLGLVPAILMTMGLAALGDRESRALPLALTAAGMALGCWLLVTVVLRMPLPAIARGLL